MKRKAKGVSEVLEKDPDGSKVLERNVFVSNSEIKAEKEQPDHEVKAFDYFKIFISGLQQCC